MDKDPFWDKCDLTPEQQKLASDTLIGWPIAALLVAAICITVAVGGFLGWWAV